MYLAYIRARLARQEGQALVEYALIISLIAVAAIAALTFLSGGIKGIVTTIGNNLKNAGDAAKLCTRSG
jgi:pilus assembly protein Flp/PilA